MFSGQGRNTYEFIHHLWGQAHRSTRGELEVSGNLLPGPNTDIIPSMVARFAQYSLGLKVFLIVPFAQGCFEELARRTQNPRRNQRTGAGHLLRLPQTEQGSLSESKQDSNCSQEHGEERLPAIQGLVLETFAEDGRPCIRIPRWP